METKSIVYSNFTVYYFDDPKKLLHGFQKNLLQVVGWAREMRSIQRYNDGYKGARLDKCSWNLHCPCLWSALGMHRVYR